MSTTIYSDLARDIVSMLKDFQFRNTMNYICENEKYEDCVIGGYIDLRHDDGVGKLTIVPKEARENIWPCAHDPVYGGWLVDPCGMHTAIEYELDLIAKHEDKDRDDWSAEEFIENAKLSLEKIQAKDLLDEQGKTYKHWDVEAESIEQFLEKNKVQKIKYSGYFDLEIAEHPEYFYLDTDVLMSLMI